MVKPPLIEPKTSLAEQRATLLGNFRKRNSEALSQFNIWISRRAFWDTNSRRDAYLTDANGTID